MPRFVLLRHQCPPDFARPSHWDLMLEDGEALATWSVAELPIAGGAPVAAQRLGDHRLAYLEYEGPLSDNRGDVRRVDAGEFRWLERQPRSLRIEASGATLRGTLVIDQLDDEGAAQIRLVY